MTRDVEQSQQVPSEREQSQLRQENADLRAQVEHLKEESAHWQLAADTLLEAFHGRSREVDRLRGLAHQATVEGEPIGLLNDAGLAAHKAEFGAEVEASESGSAAIISLDIVGLGKEWNNIHGRDYGHEALRAVAQAILENIRPGDVAARAGDKADEFYVLYRDIADPEQSFRLVRRIQQWLIDHPLEIMIEEEVIAKPVELHCGVAMYQSARLRGEPLARKIREVEDELDKALAAANQEVDNKHQRATELLEQSV